MKLKGKWFNIKLTLKERYDWIQRSNREISMIRGQEYKGWKEKIKRLENFISRLQSNNEKVVLNHREIWRMIYASLEQIHSWIPIIIEVAQEHNELSLEKEVHLNELLERWKSLLKRLQDGHNEISCWYCNKLNTHKNKHYLWCATNFQDEITSIAIGRGI